MDVPFIVHNGYKYIKKLGRGNYGQVVEVEKDGKRLAMKLIDCNSSSFSEIYFTKLFRHPNIISRIDFGFLDDKYVYFVMDLANNDLGKDIEKIDIKNIYYYTYCLANAVRYIHDGGFVHCDIKTNNILVFGNEIKLADLGIVKVDGIYNQKDIPVCQTPNYRAPEQYTLTERMIPAYNHLFYEKMEIDLIKGEYWSLGIVILDMLYGVNGITHFGNDNDDYRGYHYLLGII